MSEVTIKRYNKKAVSYEQKWKSYLHHTHRQFLRHIETEADDRLLDVSGGTGLLARELVDGGYPFRTLTVNDPSENMLSIAKSRLGDGRPIRFTNQTAEQLDFPENSFDRIFCLSSFHFFNRQQETLDRFHTILKPGGRLYILDWNRSGLFRLVNHFIRWSTSERINTRNLEELHKLLHESGLRVEEKEQWNWRYWKFLYLEGRKYAGKPGR